MLNIDMQAVASCLIKENDSLRKERGDQSELIIYLISNQYKVEELQLESFQFLNDDKKMADHFRLKIPTTQGFKNQMLCKQIHDYAEEYTFDGAAAARALTRLAQEIKDNT